MPIAEREYMADPEHGEPERRVRWWAVALTVPVAAAMAAGGGPLYEVVTWGVALWLFVLLVLAFGVVVGWLFTAPR